MNARSADSEGIAGVLDSPAFPSESGDEFRAERAWAEALRRSETYLAEAQRLSRTGSFGWNVSSGELIWSTETFCILGYDWGLKPRLEMVLQRVHPDDLALVRQMIEVASRRESNLDFEHRLLMPDGLVKHVHVIAHPVRKGSGEVEFVGAVMDVTERKRVEALVAGEKRLLEMIARGGELSRIVSDIATDPLWAEYRPLALAHGFRACWSTPIFSTAREVVGTFALYSREPGLPSPQQRNAIEQMTHLAAVALERRQAAQALRASEEVARGQAEALRRTLDALARESAPDRLVEHVLRTIIGQLEAHSSSIWLRVEGSRRAAFELAFEDGKLLTKSDAAVARISPVLAIEDVWPWPEVFSTGKPSVLEDIREGPGFPWREHVLSLGVITILVVPMLIAGQVEGVIGIRFTRKRSFAAEELELAQALAHQAMLAIQLGRLSRQSRQAAVAAERNRLARDIHDTLAQGFTGVIVQLEAAADATAGGMVKEANEHIARASDLARGSLREARRSVRALRPEALEESQTPCRQRRRQVKGNPFLSTITTKDGT